MTYTANAPERDNMPDTIMAWPDFDGCITGAWSANQYSDERAREYISRAHCDELVAAAYLDAARVPTSFLVGDPPNGIPFRSPMAHEVAEAIKDRTPDDASATLTAFGERMKAEGAREAQAKIARLTEALAIAGPIALKVFDYHLFTLDAEDQRKVETIRAALQENANG